MLIGGYGAERDQFLAGSLTPEGFVADTSGRLRLPGGEAWERSRILARGAELHVFAGHRWFKIAVADLSGRSGDRG